MTQTRWNGRATSAFAAGALGLGLASMPGVGRSQPPAAQQERPEEIVVTSSLIPTPRRQIGTAVSVIDGREMELRGYEDLADALRTQPGIGVTNSGGPGKDTTLRIRGEEGFRTMLIIDGVKAVDPSEPQISPSFDSMLATPDMERIEVLRGPQGFLYGADAGGVVNVITGRGADGFHGRFGLEAGDLGTQKLTASLSGGNERGDFYVSGTDFGTDGFNAQAADTVLHDDDGADNTTLHMKLGLNVTDSFRLQLVARDIDASAMYDGCFTPAFTQVNDCSNTTRQTTYKVSADQHGERFTNSFGYSDLDIKRDDFTQGVSSFATDGEISRVEYTGSFKSSDALALVYGVDLERDEAVSSGQDLSRDQNGYYVEYQGELGDSVYLTLGARYDDSEDFGTHTSERASIAYVQDVGGGNALKYRASYGTGFRAPSLFEISYNQRAFGVLPPAAATPLKEEISRGYDVGAEYSSAKGASFGVTYFDQDIEDAIEYVFDPSTFDDGYLQSPGRSTSKGVELDVRAPFGARWAFIGNWTNNDTSTATGERRLRRPKNLGNLGVAYTSEGSGLRLMANYRISRDAIDFGGAPLDDYAVLDLSLAYLFDKGFEVYGRVENALDEDYVEIIGFNTAGRAVYGGVKFHF